MEEIEGLAKGDAVLLAWLDSANLSGWKYEDGLLSLGVVHSAGLVLDSNPLQLIIGHSITDEGSYHSPIAIPWSSIVEFDLIKERHEN